MTAEIDGSPAAPGEIIDVHVDWTIRGYMTQYIQEMKVDTNDVANPQMTLAIMAQVPPPVKIDPAQLRLPSVRALEGFREPVEVYFYDDELEIVGHHWLDPKTNDQVEITMEPLPPDAEIFELDPVVRKGVRVWLTAPPGTKPGKIEEELTLELNKDLGRPLKMLFLAMIRGGLELQDNPDLKYSTRDNVADLGRVNRLASRTATLMLVARMDEISVEDLEIRVDEVEPAEVLEVKVGEPIDQGAVKVFPIEMTLRGQGQTMSRLGPTRDLLGHVTIGTNDARQPELSFMVKFAITQ